MIGGGRIVGLGLMIGSVVIFVAFAAWAGTALMTSETSSGGMMLGLVLALVVLTPIFGVGVYLFRSGTVEQGEYAVVQQERRILNMVLTQGQVSIGELTITAVAVDHIVPTLGFIVEDAESAVVFGCASGPTDRL